MPSQYTLTEEQTRILNEQFIPLFLNAPRAERKEKRKEIMQDAVKAISPVGIDNATLLKLETVSKVILGLRWTLI
jgi:hypothetical protein